MINYIAGALTSLISLWVGYTIGKGSSIIPEETRKQVKKLIQALPIDRGIGAIPAPTAKQVEEFNNPILKAENEAMSETFKEIVK
jgi:hypothetical protein